MTNSKNYFDPETLKRLEGLSVRGQHLIDGFFAGTHRNRRHGQSIEFAEHRPYYVGDDPKSIDWKVTARKDDTFVRKFDDETNLVCGICLDASASMNYQSVDSALSKYEYATLTALTLAQFLFRCRDAVGFSYWPRGASEPIEPTTKPSRWNDMVGIAEQNLTGGVFEPVELTEQLPKLLPKRSTLLLISDFLWDTSRLVDLLHATQARQLDCVLLQILDRAEVNLNIRQRTEFIDLETHDRLVVQPEQIARAYAREFDLHQTTIHKIANRFSADYQCFVTDQLLSDLLPGFISARQRLLRRRRSR